MVEILLVVLVLALVYAAKAASIVFAADDAVEKSVSFSWTKPAPRAADEAPTWIAQQEQAESRSAIPVRVYASRPKAA